MPPINTVPGADNGVSWDAGGAPISDRFADPYFSRSDGRGETRHIFLGMNGLPGRWHDLSGFTIAELGFGTGLNVLETLGVWRVAPRPAGARLTIVSFERYPIAAADMRRALSAWPDLAADVARVLADWPPTATWSTIEFGDATLRLAIGDANALLPAWDGRADAWYLDGFSPARNPDMWGAELMAEVFRHTVPGGTFATFTAAGWVRRNLEVAGFRVEKMAGFGGKRQSMRGSRPLT